MTQTHLDYLFQVTAANTLRAPGAGIRSGELSPAFGDHLTRSSSATQQQASRSAPADLRREKPAASAPATSDADHTPREQSSTESAQGPTKNSDQGTAPNSDARRAEDNSDVDPKRETPPAEATSENEENSQEREDANASPDSAEQAAAAAITSAADRLAEIVDQHQRKAQDPEAAVESGDMGEEPDDPGATQRVKLTLDATGFEEQSEERVSAAQLSDTADSEAAATGPPNGKPKGKSVRDERSPGEGEQRSVDTTLQRVGADGGTREATADTASDVETQALLEGKTAPAADDGTNAAADEPRRRAASSNPARAETSASTPNAVIGTTVDKPASQAAEASVRASDAAENATRVAGKSAATRNEALANILGRQHPGAGSVNRTSAGGDEELPRIDPARFIGRVAKAFHTAHERGGSLQLRLSPPELGSLRLELNVKDGVMIAALETETHSARRVLLDHLPALRDRLAEQNIRVERFDIDVRRDGGGSQGNQNEPQHQQHDQPPPRRQPATAPLSGGTEKTTPAPISTDTSQINLVA